jgi:hypothetical protein
MTAIARFYVSLHTAYQSLAAEPIYITSVTHSTLRQLYKLRRLVRCVSYLRCSALALCFSLGRIADETHTDTSFYRTRVLLFGVCVLQPAISYII